VVALVVVVVVVAVAAGLDAKAGAGGDEERGGEQRKADRHLECPSRAVRNWAACEED
jgi:hypothetical protein